MKPIRSTSVPKAAQAVYDAVVALTDAFCRDHLNDEYRDQAQAMAAALCRKRPNPLASGQPRTWACGIIHVLGQLNFLSDKATQPYMTMAEVCAGFGVGQSTASAKARVISDALHTNRMDPTWMLRSLVDQNPLVWMAVMPAPAAWSCYPGSGHSRQTFRHPGVPTGSRQFVEKCFCFF